MRAPVSVVIPTLNAEAALMGCAASLMEGLEAGLIRELVVSDGGSTDKTTDIARDIGAEVVTGPAGRGGQIARGVSASQGDWVMILHADSHLDPGWSSEVREFITAHPGDAGYFRLRFAAQGMAPALVAGWARLRAQVFSLPYGDQGLVLARATLNEVGGVPELPLMEDVALSRALKGRLVALPNRLVTSAERYERDGWLRRGARNLGTLARYFAGVDPAVLAKRYGR